MNTRTILALVMGIFLTGNARSQETTTIYPSADMWLGSSNQNAQNGDYLLVGGSNDKNMSFIKFDFDEVDDRDVEAVYLHLPPDKSRNSGKQLLSSCNLWLLTTSWSERRSNVNDRLRGYDMGKFSLSKDDGMTIEITSIYEYWKEEKNYGLLIYPNQDKKLFYFPSSESGKSSRPHVEVYFRESFPDFKLPLPKDKEWLVTTEAGDEDLASHSDDNYYSLDFGPVSRQNNQERKETRVRVYTSAKGVVYDVGYKPRTGADQTNGYYVVIDHDGDNNVNTGFQTRYLHLATQSPLRKGDTVKQASSLDTWEKVALIQNTYTLAFATEIADRGMVILDVCSGR